MKKLEKMSLANIEGKLSRKEMKNVMAGSGFKCCIGTNCSSCREYGGGAGIPVCSGGATVTAC
ncbi:hypothetical protein JI750_04135 [Flavobacterium sp. GN10]|uniref:Natural product n=1 Tax=Flavobacterium tagetis TaxID=2801336 RepID=A0ABS1K9B1_9FLAO|nr:hypothetical protein [Flavobacterium tagetis]MBL0736061.1 hypothetical protein [Flavobacterium tagetis]